MTRQSSSMFARAAMTAALVFGGVAATAGAAHAAPESPSKIAAMVPTGTSVLFAADFKAMRKQAGYAGMVKLATSQAPAAVAELKAAGIDIAKDFDQIIFAAGGASPILDKAQFIVAILTPTRGYAGDLGKLAGATPRTFGTTTYVATSTLEAAMVKGRLVITRVGEMERALGAMTKASAALGKDRLLAGLTKAEASSQAWMVSTVAGAMKTGLTFAGVEASAFTVTWKLARELRTRLKLVAESEQQALDEAKSLATLIDGAKGSMASNGLPHLAASLLVSHDAAHPTNVLVDAELTSAEISKIVDMM